VNLDQFPLSMFQVDCDGSACASGKHVGLHVHQPQDGSEPIARVVVRDHERVRYEDAR
jgi:hypothetical protein